MLGGCKQRREIAIPVAGAHLRFTKLERVLHARVD
jgi:hypothetical protein